MNAESDTPAQEPPHRGPEGRVFYGSVTVGERGQVVIPAQARRDHGIEPGQKLLALGSPDGLALMSAERLMQILDESSALRAHLEDPPAADPER